MKSRRHSRRSLVAVVGLLATLLQPVAWAQGAGAIGTSRIEGKILGADGNTPVSGATVRAYHLSTEKLHSSAVTGPSGEFEIAELPYGYYDLAVDTPEGQFIATQVVNMAPAGKVGLVFSLAPFGPGDSAAARRFPGGTQTPVGLARLDQKLGGVEFWRSPKGVAILAGGGAVLLLALASGGGGDEASPFLP